MFAQRWLLSAVLLLAVGCAPHGEAAERPRTLPSAARRDSSVSHWGLDASTEAGVSALMLPDGGQDAGPAPRILMGVNPSVAIDDTLADLDVVALGSQVTTVVYRWGAATTLDDSLERARWFTDRGLAVLFALDAVRGAQDESFDMEARGEWIRDALDTLYGSGVPLAGVVLGEALDLTLVAQAANSERFATWVGKWLQYASAHPQRDPKSRVGVHTQSHAWLEPTSQLKDWLQWTTLAAVSWYGVDADGYALPVNAARRELDVELSAADLLVSETWIRELSYPSADSVDSTPEQQAKVFAQIWEMFTAHPERQPFVAISALQDPLESECERVAQTYALPARAAHALCSIGLKDDAGNERPAFATVITGMATFALPNP